MKKQEFEDKIERAAAKIEAKIEGTADRFDKSANKAAKSKTGKWILAIIHVLIIVSLLIGGIVLLHYVQTAWAIVCFVCAGVDFIWLIIEKIIFED